MKEIILIAISAILVENFVLTKFLGICPFLGVSKKLSTALGMGGAVVFVITLSSAVTWAGVPVVPSAEGFREAR
ncbi:MAG: electron transport complex subunit RsxA, partial [Bacteroidales bacterium]|nr:electron transport complex subunit RsxA [Bacteroidales bacterium]